MKTRLRLDPSLKRAGSPLAKQIAASVISEIQRGRLAPGVLVPSSRALAEDLGVHRNTVLAAYEDLVSQGYLQTEKARGTFVSPEVKKQSLELGPRTRRTVPLDLPASNSRAVTVVKRGELPLLGGLPDLRELPVEALYRAYRANLRRDPTLLDYGEAEGHPRLLAATISYLRSQRGVVTTEERILLTRGSQQALFLAAKALLGTKRTIAVEAAGYPPAWDAFRLAGAELAPVAIDEDGIVVSALEALVRRQPIAAVYVTPHHQYPTTVSLSGPRRLELLRLAERERFVIIEDDYDHEFHFEGRPIFPLAREDDAEIVLHVGTFSKIFAPGLRIGYAVGRSELIERMTRARLAIDRQGDRALEFTLACLMEEGEFEAHVRRMFRLCEARRSVFYETMERELGAVLSFEKARGGLAVWARVRPDICVEDWVKRAKAERVLVQPGSWFWFDSSHSSAPQADVPFMRLGFSRLNEAEIVEAIRRLKRALPSRGKSRRA